MRYTSQEPCAYCGARPTCLVVWEDDQENRWFVYLCRECDAQETQALEESE